MSTRPNALGRGLGALLPSSAAARAAEPEAPAPDAPRHELPVAAIRPNPEQPRRVFDPEELERLADSIRRHGVLQPVVVRRAGDGYELVVGERRWRATQQAGLETIPVVVADVAERERLEIALVENVQRHDLNPIELALAFEALCESGATQEQVGERVGLDRSSVANHLRLLELSREIQADVETGALSFGHAKALLQTSNPQRRRQLRDRIVKEGLSVRAAEGLARPAGRTRKRGAAPANDPDRQRIVDQLRERLQTRVRIQGDAQRGRIEIEYFGEPDLRRLCGIVLGDG